MNYCETCKHRGEGGYCTSEKLSEDYGGTDEESKDMLLYSHVEGGGFWVGEKFGCVHHESISESEWKKDPPTEPGYYWARYVDTNGCPQEPFILWLIESGRAFEFGCEHEWQPGNDCFEYGRKIELPTARIIRKPPVATDDR